MADMMQQNIKYTLSTGAIERVAPSKEAIHLCEEISKGNISADGAVVVLKEKNSLAQDKDERS